ncbi:hypothetical protein V8G54_003763 [Vigna mungo]|uniref:Uncharacterized protein n=1 Tax=Vigna mungo TaxID=3915 RepID=A0AAQ3SEJ5_VIGMU
MKRTPQGWLFNDEEDSRKGKESSVNQDSDKEFSLNLEFEIRVNDRFKRTSKRINDFNKSLTTLNEKMDILFKHFIEISSSSEGSERKNVDDISEETTDEESSELE